MSTQNDCHSIPDFVLTIIFMPSIPRNSERDRSVRLDSLHTLLCRSICPSFVDFVLLFSFHYEMATEATV